MNHIYFSALLLALASPSYAQDNDLQARYLYAKAEDNYSNGLYSETIGQCEVAAGKLGSTNEKILFLELEAYAGLLKERCHDPLLSETGRVDRYLHLYLDSLSKGVDDEKLLVIMKFREDWDNYRMKGCISFGFKDLHLGIDFIDDNATNKRLPKNLKDKRIWKIVKLGGGVFSDAVSASFQTDKLGNLYHLTKDDNLYGVMISIYVPNKSPDTLVGMVFCEPGLDDFSQTGYRNFRSTYRYIPISDYPRVNASALPKIFDSVLNEYQNKFPLIDLLRITFLGLAPSGDGVAFSKDIAWPPQ